jgi:hypothetical protein
MLTDKGPELHEHCIRHEDESHQNGGDVRCML